MNKFRIGKHITLSLLNGKTVIYVDNEEFMQCKSLLLNIPTNKVKIFDDIKSIDDAADILVWSDSEQKNIEFKLSEEIEFWGHCSNLQAWVEHGYDTRLLHSNLAFPLLKKLTDAGEPMASRMYKLEILRRFNEGNILTKEFLIENNYLDCLTEQDIRSSLPIEEVSALEDLEMELKINFVLAKYLNIITEPSEWEKNYYYIENYRIIGLKIRTSMEKSIPEAIGKFKKVRYLNLSNNYFSRLPESIGELKNLEKLDIYNNKFKEIPNRIKELKRLRILDLRDNELKNIPSMIKDIGSLEILYLEKNPIPNFPKEIGNLEKTNSNRYIKKNREKF